MNSCDLFSGLGATALALGDLHGDAIAHPRVFCGSCSFSRALLSERAGQGFFGPRSNDIRIADDVKTLTPPQHNGGDGTIDLITAGYCCQDLSGMGRREGLSGTRSGLFFQILHASQTNTTLRGCS